MTDGALVRTLEELRAHFDLIAVLGYYDNGKLVAWLSDRYYDKEAASIRMLDSTTADFKKKLCDIFSVPYLKNKVDDVDLTKILTRNKRLERLKQFTADDKILSVVDRVAISQKDLVDLLDEDIKEIYLFGERFSIPESKGNITYIGLNNPKVEIDFMSSIEFPHAYTPAEQFRDRCIIFQNVDISIEDILKLAIGAKNHVEAVRLWRMAAEKGSAKAHYKLGWCYEYGNGVELNIEKAIEWYQKAAKQGYTEAQCHLGFCYYRGRGIKQNYAEAKKLFQEAAEQGYAEAQYHLGICYYHGRGVKQNYAEAAKWFQKAAGQGLAKAQYCLGICFFEGYGVVQSYKKALEWYQKSAGQGYSYAELLLAGIYFKGEEVEQDYAKAVKWARRAIQHRCYEDGLNLLFHISKKDAGFYKDFAEAFKFLTVTAQQGDTNAQFALGLAYHNGNIVDTDENKALEWYNKAAAQGHLMAGFLAAEISINKETAQIIKKIEEKSKEPGDIEKLLDKVGKRLGF